MPVMGQCRFNVKSASLGIVHAVHVYHVEESG